MPERIQAHWLNVFGRKIGLETATAEDEPLITGLLARMAEGQADFTNTFRALATGHARDQFTDPAAFDTWEAEWQRRLECEDDPTALMRRANPSVIPRNHRVEHMIDAAVADDLAPFNRLMQVLATPYDDHDEAEDLKRPPQPSEVVQATFCGT
jgi:uncharacterized protein YdiU (UPF0061 family)